jgi:hypothetical protein
VKQLELEKTTDKKKPRRTTAKRDEGKLLDSSGLTETNQ